MAKWLLKSTIRPRVACSAVPRRVQARLSSTYAPTTVFSGIQPTGVPHLGNYLGAIRNWVNLQYTSAPGDTLIYSVVGWHALTLPPEPAALYEAKFDTLASLLALGIDPKRSILFSQDDVSDHLSLSWILTCITPLGKLKRMTTWKSKLATARNANSESEIDDSKLNLGLFSYPVLQAADILVYRATHVPVGEDQIQHLELSRDLAEIFNRKYPDRSPSPSNKPLFPLPQTICTSSPRILSLRDPSQKMSKSAPNSSSRIMLTDTTDSIVKKVRSAVTDSVHGITYDPEARPGVSNLLTILAAFRSPQISSGEDSFSESVINMQALASEYASKSTAELKNDTADAVVEAWRTPRKELDRLRSNRGYLTTVLEEGNNRAKTLSSVTLTKAKERVGLANHTVPVLRCGTI